MITADTITDDEIRELRAHPSTRKLIRDLCDRALRNAGAWDRAARAKCAEIFNRRAAR